jgi:hypothetical protein
MAAWLLESWVQIPLFVFLCCVVLCNYRPLRRADHSSKGILPSVLIKLSHYTARRRLGERRYSSYSFLTSVLDGGEWSASRPGRALPPRKGSPVPIVLEAGWAPEPVLTHVREKILSPLPGIELRWPVVQSVARHYTD